MEIINLITGLSLIGVGFLVKRFPDLIAGYNTMSTEQKKNVDIDGLSTFMRNALIGIGTTLIVAYYLFKLVGLNTKSYPIVLIILVGVGVMVMVIIAQKFDHNNKKRFQRSDKK